MKRKYFVCLALALVMLTSFTAVAKGNASVIAKADPKAVSLNETKADRSMVLNSRFLNMLNHSAAYNEELASVEDLVNCATLALFDKRDVADDSFISEEYVKDYLFNMYGVECEDFTGINADFPQKDGYVYIIPRGYTEYNHSIESVTLNEDGSYTVVTLVELQNHDGEETAKAITLFVKNDASQFGFNIISSEILTDTSVI